MLEHFFTGLSIIVGILAGLALLPVFLVIMYFLVAIVVVFLPIIIYCAFFPATLFGGILAIIINILWFIFLVDTNVFG